MSQMNDSNSVARVVGAIPSGLSLLVCGGDYSVVSWVQQAGFAPLSISLALGHGRGVAPAVLAGRPFMLSLIPEGALKLTKPFLAGHAAEATALLDERGVLRGALGFLKCQYLTHANSGDHDIVVAKVLEGEWLAEDAKPYVHLRRDGGRY